MTAEQYLLWKMAEECAEIAQRCSKAAIFGLSEVQPGQTLNNSQRIDSEIKDLIVITMLCRLTGVLQHRPHAQESESRQRLAKVMKYAEYSTAQGTLPRAEYDRLCLAVQGRADG